MRASTIFVFLFGTYSFFVNHSDSRVVILDYEAEKGNLCKLAGIVDRECTNSETVLIKQALRMKQELEFEKEKNEVAKKETETERKKLKDAEKDRDLALNLAKQLACPIRIRFFLENYDLDFLNDPGEVVRRVQEIEFLVQKEFNRALYNIEIAVKKVEASVRDPGKFPEAWEALKEALPDHEQKKRMRELNGISDTNVPSSGKPDTNLGSALQALYNAKHVDAARKLWEKQCKQPKKKTVRKPKNSISEDANTPLSTWNVLPGVFTSRDNTTLRLLAYEKIIFMPDQPTDEFFKTERDRSFARDFILSERYFEGELTKRNRNEYYKKCRRVLYFSTDFEIESLRESLADETAVQNVSKWKKPVPLFRRYERYCEVAGRLWHKVSSVSIHAGGLQVISKSCLPKSEDFELYTASLSATGDDDLAFVVHSMSTNYNCRILPKVRPQSQEEPDESMSS